ncbi:MAG: hypothetical protein EHM77_09355 [Planctomycetaceae bacterium]|nr:MAG: hypothetical protein EHM77_09355 [Planctomycetaceae bacterium]
MAKTQLRDFKVTKDLSLAKIESLLTQLSSRAVSTLPPGESRKQLQNMEAIQALTRSLPAYSQNVVSTQFSLLSARRGKAVSFQELMRGLNVHRAGIDADIKSFGAEPKKNQGNQGKLPPLPKIRRKVKTPLGHLLLTWLQRLCSHRKISKITKGKGKRSQMGKSSMGKRKVMGTLNLTVAYVGCPIIPPSKDAVTC